MMTRRDMLTTSAAALAATTLRTHPILAQTAPLAPAETPAAPGIAGADYAPVTIPNSTKLPYKLIDGTKVFHLIAQEVQHEFAPGLTATCWGYNGSTPGPAIEAVDGDHIRIYLTNQLPEATSLHCHGLLLPNGMDGVGGLTQKSIQPGETFKYEFTLRQSGTVMYHAHHDEMTQIGLGMTGLFIIHPRPGKKYPDARESRPPVDRDFALLLHEWRIDPGTSRPNPSEMTDFNILTMNAKVFPATDPLLIKTGDRVRIRLANLSPMSHHPIHMHGHHFRVTDTDAGPIPLSAQHPETTVLVPTGTSRTIEFTADQPGDWALHCHMTHHVMNQMGHNAPNMIGVKPGNLDQQIQPLLPAYMTMGQSGMADMMKMPTPTNSIAMLGAKGQYDAITMGGMSTVLKIRDTLPAEDPGWYAHPPETLACLASAADLARDGIADTK